MSGVCFYHNYPKRMGDLTYLLVSAGSQLRWETRVATLLDSLADPPSPEVEFTFETPLSSMAAQLVETGAMPWLGVCPHEMIWLWR